MDATIRKAIWCSRINIKKPSWIDEEDLIQEGHLAVIESQRTYCPGKSSEKTWAVNYIRYRMKTLMSKYHPEIYLEDLQQESSLPATTSQDFLEIYSSLGKDAKQLVKMIISSPEDFLQDTPKASRGEIIKKLKKQGWTWERIWKVLSDIKSELRH